MPLAQEKLCNCGEGGRRPESYKLALFEQTTLEAEVIATLSTVQGTT